eukprot:11958814-Ditylum_brightwellii.AAC.1
MSAPTIFHPEFQVHIMRASRKSLSCSVWQSNSSPESLLVEALAGSGSGIGGPKGPGGLEGPPGSDQDGPPGGPLAPNGPYGPGGAR